MTMNFGRSLALAIGMLGAALSVPAGAVTVGKPGVSAPSAIEQVGERYGRRGLSYDELVHYCNMGSQTPISMREDCRRAGIGGWGRPHRHRSQAMDWDALQYYCNMGSQTPISMRADCRRARIGGW